MKWITVCLAALLLSACGYSTVQLVEYRQVTVRPLVTTTTIGYDTGYYGSYGCGSDYSTDFSYFQAPVDIATVSTSCY